MQLKAPILDNCFVLAESRMDSQMMRTFDLDAGKAWLHFPSKD
jgi:hypothetical protein